MSFHTRNGGSKVSAKSISAFVAAAGLALASQQADALIINNVAGTGSTPAANLVAPTDDPGWNYVGRAGSNGTGIYIGNGWMLTATHVATNNTGLFNLNGVSYDGTGESVILRNSNNTNSDLRLYKLATDPGLPSITLSTTPLSELDDVVMIGTGRMRTGDAVNLNIDTGPGPDPQVKGYAWGSRDKAWGTSQVSSSSFVFNSQGRDVTGFAMDFRDLEGEASAAEFDSGSAVFHFNTDTGEWELAGVPLVVNNLLSDGTNIYSHMGDNNPSFDPTQTLAADLSFYAASIIATTGIPEPSTVVLMSAGALLLVKRRRD